MLAWLDWWDEFNADHKRDQHAEADNAMPAFIDAARASIDEVLSGAVS